MVKLRLTNKSLSIKDRYNGIKKNKIDPIIKVNYKYPRDVLKKDTSNKIIIKYAIKNERTARILERDNTLVFIVDVTATKSDIKKAIIEKYNKPVKKINTLIKFKKHEKKAFVKFVEPGTAIEIASKVGIL